MSNEWKREINHELADMKFQAQEQVVRRVKPKRFEDKLRAFLNKEIELSLVPIGAVLIIGLALIGAGLYNPYGEFEKGTVTQIIEFSQRDGHS